MPSLLLFQRFPFVRATALLLAGLVSCATWAAGAPPPESSPKTAAAIQSQLFGLAMQFEKNAGQTDSKVQFLSRGPGYTLFLSPTEAVLSLRSASNSPPERTSRSHHQRR